MSDIYIGNVKGPQGATGATGAQGPQGEAATIEVGTVSTTAYGNPAQVTNSGTAEEAVFDFVIPAGRPGEETTSMSALTLDTITAQTATFPVPAVGERGAVVFGKIIKFFSDTVASLANKLNVSDVVNNLTSTATNKPLSAAQGKALNDALGNKLSKVRTTVITASNRNATIAWANYSFICFMVNCTLSGQVYRFAYWTPTSIFATGAILCLGGNDVRINVYNANTLRLDRALINSSDVTESAGFYVYAW